MRLTLTASNGRSLTSSNAAEVAYLSRRGVVDLHLGKSSEMRIGLVSANPGLPLRPIVNVQMPTNAALDLP